MGRPKIEVRESFEDVLEAIEASPAQNDKISVYRGHGSCRYKLSPSLFRQQNARFKRHERTVLRELISRHPADFETDGTNFERLVRMQHYELPTRLLDVTYNPLVALYFACSGSQKEHPELVTLQISKDEVRYYDSDTVHCLAHLSSLTHKEQNALEESVKCNEDISETIEGKRLADFIRQERPGFEARIRNEDLNNFYFVSPKLNNPRVAAQSGAFIICGFQKEIKSNNRCGIRVDKIRISKDARTPILERLSSLGVTEASLFPELDRTAKEIKERYN